MHSLLASPFLGQYLILRPGQAQGVQIHSRATRNYLPPPKGGNPVAGQRRR